LTQVLALDLGGTSFKAAVVDDAGNVRGHTTAPSAEVHGVAAWLAAAHELAASFTEPVDAVGVSVPGAVDAARGVLVDLVARLDAGDGVSLPAAFADFGVPVFADNDARAALAAERRFGAARGCDNVVVFTLGTGLGGAAVVNGIPAGGEPVLGGSQIGHFTIDIDGPKCVCGNHGCAETFVSATGLLRMARDAGLQLTDARDALAIPEITEQFSAALAAVVVTAIHAYQPEIIVFGGGLMGSSGSFMPRAVALAKERAWVTAGRAINLQPSPLGEHLGVLGAAAVALNHLEDKP
jgi:glucokinase